MQRCTTISHFTDIESCIGLYFVETKASVITALYDINACLDLNIHQVFARKISHIYAGSSTCLHDVCVCQV